MGGEREQADLDAATAHLDPPFAVVDLDAFDHSGADRPPIRVCLDVDASWRPLGGSLHVGARRSPVHTPAQAAALARTVVQRPGFALAGVMAYEAQIAGVGDRPPGAPLRGVAVRWMQRRSAAELARRRAGVVAAVRGQAPGLELVNGGGTGSVDRTVAEPAVTEVAAGSGLFAPTLFDAYAAFAPRPAALFSPPSWAPCTWSSRSCSCPPCVMRSIATSTV